MSRNTTIRIAFCAAMIGTGLGVFVFLVGMWGVWSAAGHIFGPLLVGGGLFGAVCAMTTLVLADKIPPPS